MLAGDKIYDRMPRSRAWGGYPYAVVSNAEFPAQQRKPNLRGQYEFLARELGKEEAFVKDHSKRNLSLRVSDDRNMAIENTDLTNRQPKVFYATRDVINNANQLLSQVNSRVTLQVHASSVTILTGWYSQNELRQVRPIYHKDKKRPHKKFRMEAAPQNCNAVAAEVIGSTADTVSSQGGSAAFAAARRLAPIASQRFQTAWDDPSVAADVVERLQGDVAEEYVENQYDGAERAEGINRYATPEVGHTFMIGTIGYGVPQANGKSRVRDYESGQDRDLGWSYHFGGVVARSGTDRVTLENYARGDNRQNAGDPRWYFQMYGEQEGQSFHEFHKAKNEYANPVTISL